MKRVLWLLLVLASAPPAFAAPAAAPSGPPASTVKAVYSAARSLPPPPVPTTTAPASATRTAPSAGATRRMAPSVPNAPRTAPSTAAVNAATAGSMWGGVSAASLRSSSSRGGLVAAPATPTRVRDVARVHGVNSNPLVGYGLVVGLTGTGDSQSPVLQDMVARMLGTLGLPPNAKSGQMKMKNAALVSVTAELPASSREGDTVDVTVSSMGDASSLEGGTLLLSSLRGADNEIYAAAQGPILVGSSGGVRKGGHNVGTLERGALVMRSSTPTLAKGDTLQWVLKENDFGVATAVAAAINGGLGSGVAVALDNGIVQVSLGGNARSDVVGVIARIEALPVEMPAAVARVVVNERTGTVVMGGHVVLRPVAIAHAGMRITVGAGDNQRTLVTAAGTTVDELVRSLNALGVSPRDLITILQALKRASALQADLVTM